jgi:hypothetical protein
MGRGDHEAYKGHVVALEGGEKQKTKKKPFLLDYDCYSYTFLLDDDCYCYSFSLMMIATATCLAL